jgi:hypothetical protein
MKSTKKTAVMGTSRFFVGMPPKIASGGAKGPRPTRCISAGMKLGVAEDRRPVVIEAKAEEEDVATSVAFSNLPAARPLTSAGFNNEVEDGSTELAPETVETISGVIVAAAGIGMNEVDTDIMVDTEAAAAIAEGAAVTDNVTVDVTVLGGIAAGVTSRVEVTVLAKMVGVAASVDVCEPISRCLQKKFSSREMVLKLTISKNWNHT